MTGQNRFRTSIDQRGVTALVSAKLVLTNPCKPERQAVDVDAIGDTASMHLRIPPDVQLQLGLDEIATREVVFSDGRTQVVPYVGPVELRFKNRVGFVGACVLGDQVLLGAIPMEDMDLVVIPSTRTVDVNPSSPNIAAGIVK
jgi:hypothetical protein